MGVTVITEWKSVEEIEDAVIGIAQSINEEYEGHEIVLLGILNGGAMFMSDLMRHIHVDVRVDYVQCSSYGDGTESGEVELIKKWTTDLSNKHVILVDDIYDTGNTINTLSDLILGSSNPKSIVSCALIKRQDEDSIGPNFFGLEANKGDWLYGYGMDDAGLCRNIPSIMIKK